MSWWTTKTLSVSVASKFSFQKWPFYAISASDSDINPRHTTSMPPVKIFAFLDLAQNSSFLK
jgi:hypothetical protein